MCSELTCLQVGDAAAGSPGSSKEPTQRTSPAIMPSSPPQVTAAWSFAAYMLNGFSVQLLCGVCKSPTLCCAATLLCGAQLLRPGPSVSWTLCLLCCVALVLCRHPEAMVLEVCWLKVCLSLLQSASAQQRGLHRSHSGSSSGGSGGGSANPNPNPATNDPVAADAAPADKQPPAPAAGAELGALADGPDQTAVVPAPGGAQRPLAGSAALAHARGPVSPFEAAGAALTCPLSRGAVSGASQ